MNFSYSNDHINNELTCFSVKDEKKHISRYSDLNYYRNMNKTQNSKEFFGLTLEKLSSVETD